MSVHITKTYNIGGLIGLRQNAVKNAGETLGFKEMSLFKFPDAYDSDDELHVRMDGIIASLCPEDIVIFQHPSGESPRYDGFLFEHLRRYHGTKIVAFIQEIASDRDDSEYALSDEITLLNRADMFIFASAALRDYYIAKHKCINKCKYIGKHECIDQRLNKCKYISKHECLNKRIKEHVLLYKLLYSFMTMLVYMVGRNIPLYGIDIDAYSNVNVDAQSILLQAISGDMKNCSIFIIGLWPYMLASMLAILIVAIMSLDHTRKLSPKKINIWTVTIMMIIAAVQAYHKTQTLMYRVSGYELIWNKIIVFIQLIAGMLIVVYMCDRATKYGIGGKVSVFVVNIVSGMMTMFTGKPLEKLALPVAIGVAEIAVMIVLETTEKRIAVQRVSINNIYADKNYIAYKLNPVGATPLMFASAAFLLPQFMCNGLHYLFPDNADIQWWMDNMRLTSPLGIVVYMVIICLLTIIFSMVMLSPGRTADDLLKSGDSIQDIYAGKPTKRYLIGTVLSFSVISSIIICICQGGPLFLQFGGYVDASLAMLPCSIMMTTGLWISLYREAEVYRNMDRYHTFI